MIDVAIAGGGPVGLATALYAVRAGLTVTVFEPRGGPIDKACGEGLMPGALAALEDLGVSPHGMPLRGIRYVRDGHRAEAVFRHGPGRGVRRTTLHAALSSACAAVGVQLLPEPVTAVTPRPGSVLVNGRRAGYLVAADGLHSPTRRLLGLNGRPLRRRRYGQRVHVHTEPWTDLVEVHWSPVAEAYVTPVAEDRVGVAVLTASREPFASLLPGFPGLVDRLADVPVSRVLGAGPLRQRSRRRVAGRVLLVGDASGYVDALTGEGIALGLAQASAAVDAIAAGRPECYELAWRRVSWRYQLLTHTLLGAARVPPARRALVPLAAALPGVFGAAVNELAR